MKVATSRTVARPMTDPLSPVRVFIQLCHDALRDPKLKDRDRMRRYLKAAAAALKSGKRVSVKELLKRTDGSKRR